MCAFNENAFAFNVQCTRETIFKANQIYQTPNENRSSSFRCVHRFVVRSVQKFDFTLRSTTVPSATLAVQTKMRRKYYSYYWGLRKLKSDRFVAYYTSVRWACVRSLQRDTSIINFFINHNGSYIYTGASIAC